MLKKAFKKNEKSDISVQIDRIMTCLKDIYSNKSSDEYKCHGDIAKSPQYERIEYSVAQLSTIKSYPDNDAKALKNLFNSLHRPIFGKMVTAYLAKPDDRNIVEKWAEASDRDKENPIYKKLHEIWETDNYKVDGDIFYPEGAFNPVRAYSTPKNLPDEMIEYKRK